MSFWSTAIVACEISPAFFTLQPAFLTLRDFAIVLNYWIIFPVWDHSSSKQVREDLEQHKLTFFSENQPACLISFRFQVSPGFLISAKVSRKQQTYRKSEKVILSQSTHGEKTFLSLTLSLLAWHNTVQVKDQYKKTAYSFFLSFLSFKSGWSNLTKF